MERQEYIGLYVYPLSPYTTFDLEKTTPRGTVCVCVAGGGLVVKREGGEGCGVCGGVREETGGVGESHSRPLSHQVTLT